MRDRNTIMAIFKKSELEKTMFGPYSIDLYLSIYEAILEVLLDIRDLIAKGE